MNDPKNIFFVSENKMDVTYQLATKNQIIQIYSRFFKKRSQRSSSKDFLKKLLSPNCVIVTVNNDLGLIGYLMAFQKEHELSISDLWIDIRFRRKSLASNLINFLEIKNKSTSIRKITVRIPETYKFLKKLFCMNNFKFIENINEYQHKTLSIPFNGNMNLEVKIADNRDIPSLLSIENDCFNEFWRMSEKRFNNILQEENSIIYLGIMKDKIISYNYNVIDLKSRVGSLVRIATLPSYQRQNVAKRMIRNAFDNYFNKNKVKFVYLSTHASSEWRNEMYKKLGFIYTSREAILSKELNP